MDVDTYLLVCQDCHAVFASSSLNGPDSCSACGKSTFKQFDLSTALTDAGIKLG